LIQNKLIIVKYNLFCVKLIILKILLVKDEND